MAILFPALRRTKTTAGRLEYVILIPFKSGQSIREAPFAAASARFVLQVHLTRRPIPFEENAIHFAVFQEAELRTKSSRIKGFISLPVTRHTVFWKGSGGALERHADRMDLGLCDERRAIAAKCSFKLDRPFGRGSILPQAAQSSRTIFQASQNMDVEICEETLELGPSMKSGFLKSRTASPVWNPSSPACLESTRRWIQRPCFCLGSE